MAVLDITMGDTELLHDTRHGVPKCVTPHPNGKLYYVDIRVGEVLEYDPATGAPPRKIPTLDPATGAPESATAIGLNKDGSLVIARQSGVYFLKPDAAAGDQWHHVCEIPGVGTKLRPNNGVMVKCHDGETRFFLGTATISGVPIPDGKPKPSSLFVLEPNKSGRLVLREVASDLVTVNAVSGQVIDGKTQITFADSYLGESVLRTGTYSRFTEKLGDVQDVMDFKQGDATATNGRPDGTSPLLFNNKPAIAVAAIDTNEIRVIALDTKEVVAKITLPETIKKPTMATFTTNPEGKTVCYVSTLLPPKTPEAPNAPDVGGNIYTKIMPEAFKAIEYQGTYPPFAALVSASDKVATKPEGQRLG